MNGNGKGVWIAGAALLAGAAYWYYSQTSGAAGEGGSAGDTSGSGGGASASQSDGGPAQVLSRIGDYFSNLGSSLGIVTPRGIRNHNPFNLRYVPAIAWKGQIGDDGGGYAVFDTDEDGVRAGGHQLRTYLSRGINTVRAIISTFAPSTENDTQAYIDDVANRAAVDPDQPLDASSVPALGVAIVWHEEGIFPYDINDFTRWITEP